MLLIHRALRDDDMCQKKYGNGWNRYKQEVPYSGHCILFYFIWYWFIPGII